MKIILKKISAYLAAHNEMLTIPLALLLWFISPSLLRAVDPTAGAFDAGVLQIILFAIIALFILQAVVWFIIKTLWPTVRLYYENQFANDFKLITPWERLKASLSLYFFLLLLLVLLTRVL